jgi:hypothetical protein
MKLQEIKTNKKVLEEKISELVFDFIHNNGIEIEIDVEIEYTQSPALKERKCTGVNCEVTGLIR